MSGRGASASRAAYVLLGLMTLVSFGGPFLIWAILWSGERSGWPPDRPIEWLGVGAVLVVFLACFVACLTIRLWIPRVPSGALSSREGEAPAEPHA